MLTLLEVADKVPHPDALGFGALNAALAFAAWTFVRASRTTLRLFGTLSLLWLGYWLLWCLPSYPVKGGLTDGERSAMHDLE